MNTIIERRINSDYIAARETIQESIAANPGASPICTSPIIITKNCIIPAISFVNTGKLILGENVTVTINDLVGSPENQIFDISAKGSMVLLPNVRKVKSTWFGCINSSMDCSSLLNKIALMLAVYRRGSLIINGQVHTIETSINFYDVQIEISQNCHLNIAENAIISNVWIDRNNGWTHFVGLGAEKIVFSSKQKSVRAIWFGIDPDNFASLNSQRIAAMFGSCINGMTIEFNPGSIEINEEIEVTKTFKFVGSNGYGYGTSFQQLDHSKRVFHLNAGYCQIKDIWFDGNYTDVETVLIDQNAGYTNFDNCIMSGSNLVGLRVNAIEVILNNCMIGYNSGIGLEIATIYGSSTISNVFTMIGGAVIFNAKGSNTHSAGINLSSGYNSVFMTVAIESNGNSSVLDSGGVIIDSIWAAKFISCHWEGSYNNEVIFSGAQKMGTSFENCTFSSGRSICPNAILIVSAPDSVSFRDCKSMYHDAFITFDESLEHFPVNFNLDETNDITGDTCLFPLNQYGYLIRHGNIFVSTECPRSENNMIKLTPPFGWIRQANDQVIGTLCEYDDTVKYEGVGSIKMLSSDDAQDNYCYLDIIPEGDPTIKMFQGKWVTLDIESCTGNNAGQNLFLAIYDGVSSAYMPYGVSNNYDWARTGLCLRVDDNASLLQIRIQNLGLNFPIWVNAIFFGLGINGHRRPSVIPFNAVSSAKPPGVFDIGRFIQGSPGLRSNGEQGWISINDSGINILKPIGFYNGYRFVDSYPQSATPNPTLIKGDIYILNSDDGSNIIGKRVIKSGTFGSWSGTGGFSVADLFYCFGLSNLNNLYIGNKINFSAGFYIEPGTEYTVLDVHEHIGNSVNNVISTIGSAQLEMPLNHGYTVGDWFIANKGFSNLGIPLQVLKKYGRIITVSRAATSSETTISVTGVTAIRVNNYAFTTVSSIIATIQNPILKNICNQELQTHWVYGSTYDDDYDIGIIFANTDHELGGHNITINLLPGLPNSHKKICNTGTGSFVVTIVPASGETSRITTLNSGEVVDLNFCVDDKGWF
jgi:hypothetical protein